MDSSLDTLFKMLKNELNITWDDEETELRLSRIVLNATKVMDRKLGATIDYSLPGQEQELFIAYCMYVYNNVANEFDENYLNEIMQIRILHEVEDYSDEED